MFKHLIVGKSRGGERRGMIAFHVGAGKIGVVEEVGEEFGERFFGFDAVALFRGAGLGPVEEWVPGDNGDNVDVFVVGEKSLGSGPTRDVFFIFKGARRINDFARVVSEAEGNGEGEVCACGEARQGNVADVKAQNVGIIRKVEEGIDRVINSGWKRMFGCKTIVDTDNDAVDISDQRSEPVSIVERCA